MIGYKIMDFFTLILINLESIQRCLSYERVIIEENITNLRLVVTHDAIKRSAVSDALKYIDYAEKYFKKTKVKIQNVAAVIAITVVIAIGVVGIGIGIPTATTRRAIVADVACNVLFLLLNIAITLQDNYFSKFLDELETY